MRDLAGLLEAAKKGFSNKMKEAPEFIAAVRLSRDVLRWTVATKNDTAAWKNWEDQATAAVVSVPANIGEASARATHRQLLQYYQVAFGSNWELLALMMCCPVEVPEELWRAANDVSRLIGARLERLVSIQ